MSKRDVLLLLDDMLQPAQKIKRYTKDLNYDSFYQMIKQLMPLLGILKLLVEAANRIDSDFRDNHPEIEWKRTAAVEIQSGSRCLF